MKIALAYRSNVSRDSSGYNILIWPDSSMIKSGKPIFLNDLDECNYILTGIGAKIKSVGKSIKSKFASRYYDEMMPMAFITKHRVADLITKNEDPKACDIVTDYAVVNGNTFLKDILETKDELKVEVKLTSLYISAINDGSSIDTAFICCDIEKAVDNAIESASKGNTLKTGDIVAFLLPGTYPAEHDNLLEITIDGRKLLETKLK